MGVDIPVMFGQSGVNAEICALYPNDRFDFGAFLLRTSGDFVVLIFDGGVRHIQFVIAK